MNDVLERCLDDLESRIDPQVEGRLWQAWDDFSGAADDTGGSSGTGGDCHGAKNARLAMTGAAGVAGESTPAPKPGWITRNGGGLFSPSRAHKSPPGVDWPNVLVNAALADHDAMLLQQYGGCSAQLSSGSGLLMNVRSNYGTSIIPLLFGVELFVMDEELNTLPTSWPLQDIDAIRRLVDAGVPDIRQKYMANVLEMGERYAEIAAQYPKIGAYVQIYHPDLQGPMDIVEVIWGSSVFYALYDQPDLVMAFLELITETYIACMRAWLEIVPFREAGNAHWGLYHRGNIMLRDDSAMNLSVEMFDEFIRPYDQRLLDEFGGGAIHYCGKGDHYAPVLAEMDGLYAVHMSQPEYNDLDAIWRHLVDNGIKLIGLRSDAGEAALARGLATRGNVHCPGGGPSAAPVESEYRAASKA